MTPVGFDTHCEGETKCYDRTQGSNRRSQPYPVSPPGEGRRGLAVAMPRAFMVNENRRASRPRALG